MPYNTNAIPPRKEPTGQTQLPLSRVKKIITQDPDVQLCSSNAAFVITLAAELFIQHLADEAYTQAKLDRKPRRNIQYKDIANAISHHDNLEFLEDTAPKTVPFKKVKAIASAAQARLRSEATAPSTPSASTPQSRILTTTTNGHGHGHGHPLSEARSSSLRDPPNGAFFALSTREPHKTKPKPKQPRQRLSDEERDSNAQLELEMRQAKDRADIDMTG